MIIFGPLLIVFGVFITVCAFVEKHNPPKVGDVFGMTNPGISADPNARPNPFVAIYTITEIKDGKLKTNMYYLHADGTTHGGEAWQTDTMFDTKLSKP